MSIKIYIFDRLTKYKCSYWFIKPQQMRIYHFLISLFIFLIFNNNSFTQEGLPIYSDYLTDNFYLLYPSMAVASNCTKVRFTGRKQWMDQDASPNLQTFGELHGKQELPNNYTDRIEPGLLEAFKKNPFTQSLSSY